MPYIRQRLTKQEVQFDWAQAQRMRALGIQIPIPQQWHDCQALSIEIADKRHSLLFQTPGGTSAYVIEVRLTAYDPTIVVDCQIVSDFDDDIVLASVPPSGLSYKHGGREFRIDEVLNHRFASGMLFRRGVVVQGIVLACGLRPIPAHLRYSASVGCTCTFLDQQSNAFAGHTSLFLDSQPRKSSAPRRGAGLYGRTPESQPEAINQIVSRPLEAQKASTLAQEKEG